MSTKAEPSEIPGLYIGIDDFVVIDGPLTISTSRSYLCIHSGGIIVDGYPDDGLEMTAPDPADPFTGRYAATDTTLEIEWNDGSRTRAKRLAPTVLELFGRSYARLDRCTDLPLEGLYARLDGDPGWPVIRFGPGDTFDDAGILIYTGLTAAPRWIEHQDALAQFRGPGTFRVSNNTLYLDYAGAGPITACIYVPSLAPLETPIAEFDLNGYSFARSESFPDIPPGTWMPGQL